MDSELFTVGGGPRDLTGRSSYVPEKQTADVGEVYYQAAKLMRVSRFCGQALYWLIVFLTLYVVAAVIPMLMKVWKDGLKPASTTSGFSQKEGLQYLGASTNVVRDDTGWPSTLSPAELAALSAQRETNMDVAPKAAFSMPRERMEPTPEEKLLAQQKK